MIEVLEITVTIQHPAHSMQNDLRQKDLLKKVGTYGPRPARRVFPWSMFERLQ